MPRAAIDFGELRPDDAQHASPGLVTVNGAYAAANGYRPIGGFMSFADALSGTFKGGGSFIGTDGSSRLLAGNATDLYSGASGSWSSKIGLLIVNDRWRFTQFGDDIVCTNGGEPIKFTLTTNTATVLGGSPPTADFCATVRDFVVLGRAAGAQNVVQWSGQGDCNSWTAGTDQSGLQPIYAGGKIMGLTSGEVCYIIQRFQVVRMAYTGDPTDPWQFDAISTYDGCVAEGSLVQAGALFFFLGDRGFTMFDGQEFKPIGAERIDRAFKSQYSVLDLQNLWTAIDPERYLVIWAINGRLWIYNWFLDRWTEADIPVGAVFQSFTEGVSLDALDAIYGDLDSIPYSLDDARFSGGTPRLTVVHNDGRFGVLTGDNIAARIELPFMELAADREARVNVVRPITDAISGLTLTVDSRRRLGDPANISTFTQLNSHGDMPVRIAGRSLKVTLDVAAAMTWDYVQGLEIAYQVGGRS